MSSRHQVIIAAAVAALAGRRARIVRIRELPDQGWTGQGRAAVQTSHGLTAPLIRIARSWGLVKK